VTVKDALLSSVTESETLAVLVVDLLFAVAVSSSVIDTLADSSSVMECEFVTVKDAVLSSVGEKVAESSSVIE